MSTLPNLSSTPQTLRVFPKINLFLEIIRRRFDNYHEIVSVMQIIDNVCDDLTISPTQNGDDLSLSISENSTGENLSCDEKNLILRAAKKLREVAGIKIGAHFTLKKNIPCGAGLGGGSADAAAAIKLCANFWQLEKVNFPREKLVSVAGQIGSDVPFFLVADLMCPLAIAFGRGEIIQPLPSSSGIKSLPISLLVPPWQTSTADAYQALNFRNFNRHPLNDFLLATTRGATISSDKKNDADKIFAASFNIFETPFADASQSPAARLAKFLADAGSPFRISGSGSAMWAPKLSAEQAENLRRRLDSETEFRQVRIII